MESTHLPHAVAGNKGIDDRDTADVPDLRLWWFRSSGSKKKIAEAEIRDCASAQQLSRPISVVAPIAIPDLKATVGVLRLNRRKNYRTMSISGDPVRRFDVRPMRLKQGDRRCL